MRLFILLVTLSLLVVGCADFAPVERQNQSELKLCAADVMVCPDGSFVTRDPENDCNYKPCSEEGYGDPALGWRPEE